MTLLLILLGKLISFISRLSGLGNGSTWPGEITLMLKSHILLYFLKQVKKAIIIVAGTNGKTTTAKMIKEILKDKVIYNDSGANLLNGIVSAFIQKASFLGKIDANYAVLETDENTLTQLIHIKKKKLIIVILNLFRDQLDRYGEVDIIASKWNKALANLDNNATLILNADDPQIAYLGQKKTQKIIYFGIDKPEKFLKLPEHAVDSTFCRNCGTKLNYQGIYFSHIGIWHCIGCGIKRPKIALPNINSYLPGLYNEYNTQAAILVGKELAIDNTHIEKTLKEFTPAFGRQEEIILNGKQIKIFLSKNPAGFNASLRTVVELKAKKILLVLNDRIPDGRDVSWIYDVDFEMIPDDVTVIVSGDRVYDMGLRIKYSMKQLIIKPDLKQAIDEGLKKLSREEILYILPTYSAMLEVRKILKGRKIL